MNNDPFILGGVTLASRLFIGTGKYGADSLIPSVAEASGAEVITVAMRRVGKQQDTQGIMGHIPAHMRLLPNTSGARTAEEAVRLAETTPLWDTSVRKFEIGRASCRERVSSPV